jgi:hypothetical protein
MNRLYAGYSKIVNDLIRSENGSKNPVILIPNIARTIIMIRTRYLIRKCDFFMISFSLFLKEPIMSFKVPSGHIQPQKLLPVKIVKNIVSVDIRKSKSIVWADKNFASAISGSI